MTSRRRDEGQATVEYVALIALVALVLAVGGVVVAATTGVGERVAYAVRHGLCVVAGVLCPAPAQPCVVNRDTTSDNATVTLGIVRLGEDAVVMRELRSDGRILVTLVGGLHGGAEIGIGAGGQVVAGGAKIGGGAELRAAAIARAGNGRTWIARNAAEADRLIEQLGAHETTPLVDVPVELADQIFGGAAAEVRAPDIEWSEGGTGGDAGGTVGVGPISASATLSLKQVLGMRTDHTTGRHTVYFRLDNASSAKLAAQLLGVSVRTTAPTSLEVTFDRDWRPYELAAVTNQSATAVLHAPAGLRTLVTRTIGSRLSAPGVRIEVAARLDLTAPANVDATKRLLDALAHPGHPEATLGAIGGLGERLVNGSRLEARLYDATSNSLSAGGHSAVGAGLGGSAEHRTEGSKLARAWERPPDGVWAERRDCLDAARRLVA